MSKTWFISDTHFHHGNILNFVDEKQNHVRPDFQDVHHMDNYMVERWNSVVRPDDKVYHLGDVLMGTSIEAFEILSRLNGRKVLIKGNHDTAKIQRYTDHFTDVRSEIHKKLPDGRKIIFTHRPIRLSPDEETFNVHGHIHQRSLPDPRYINVSVEVLRDYTPISWEGIVLKCSLEK